MPFIILWRTGKPLVMATALYVVAQLRLTRFGPEFKLTTRTPTTSSLRPSLRPLGRLSPGVACLFSSGVNFRQPKRRDFCRNLSLSPVASMFAENSVVRDLAATAFSGGVALSILRLWGEAAKRGVFDQKLIRKLVHVSIGLAFMLCWPLFSSDHQAPVFASFIPGLNIIRVLLIGLGIWTDEATVKSMSRYGDSRELLKGPLYYVSAITLTCVIYWRTSPIAIAAICNLCAGDGLADIVGRRFGNEKLPYNRNKSIAGSIAMATASFIASLGFMHYFFLFGFVKESWKMAWGFLVVSVATALVESLPISTGLDDNLTVPLTSVLVGSLVF